MSNQCLAQENVEFGNQLAITISQISLTPVFVLYVKFNLLYLSEYSVGVYFL